LKRKVDSLIKYCVKCLLPGTKPDLSFDNFGVCSACNAFLLRPEVNWGERKKEFMDIVAKYKVANEGNWDCIVPVSGGKDSTVQVLKMLELGLNPLVVNARTCDFSELGRQNLENIKALGVDCLEFSPNPIVRKRLNKICLELVGDISWPEHVGIFTIPVRAAVEYSVPLIIWGENSQNEYGGPASAQKNNVLTRKWLEEFGGLLGLRVSDLVESGLFSEKELLPYRYPSDEKLSTVGVTGLFLGHYFEWDGLSNYLLAQVHGFKTFERNVEGSFVNYENLDNHQTGIHDYFKFLKYGFGRATDIASLHIRRGRITREQGLSAIRDIDGSFPNSCLGKPLVQILNDINLSVDDFLTICDKYTNKSIFKINGNGQLIRSENGNLVKINYDNYVP
jgi:N-acetyl sugar amidotransferase